ncbi:hypothetical protein SAMN06295974_3796 [Plantibacter flavus]|uniref:Uncharacterized protein n=1 Tax=Plantibacter flavus TaxID=150123 RepID=A0A3N2BLC7_9MICO|nr:hypothetical protein [Plantibacter flavus]ROR76056.1 hypothetical protein EDD42_4009 [Plantibacter flavus]SMG48956.1 hypothetical protein SAMN06295974_3796 [Plantibacter flavus]
MSTFEATARTNHFRVRDVAALRAELATYGIHAPNLLDHRAHGAALVLDDRDVVTGTIALFGDMGWPSLDEDAVRERFDWDESISVPDQHQTLVELIASHLEAGQVAIFLEVGHEKMRFLSGSAVAVNASGETRSIELEDIYGLASELTSPEQVITPAHV